MMHELDARQMMEKHNVLRDIDDNRSCAQIVAALALDEVVEIKRLGADKSTKTDNFDNTLTGDKCSKYLLTDSTTNNSRYSENK